MRVLVAPDKFAGTLTAVDDISFTVERGSFGFRDTFSPEPSG